MQYDLAVYIGRFQPPHIGHINTIINALDISQKVLVIMGDYRTARSIKNPFYFDERKEMIVSSIPAEFRNRIFFEAVRNYPYNDNLWVANIQSKVAEYSDGKICMTGHLKDTSSYYLQLFPQWSFEPSPIIKGIHATGMREIFFEKENFETSHEINSSLSQGAIQFLANFKNSENYQILKEEYDFIKNYKSLWENAPFPPTFITTDAVVLKSGHILVVKRKSSPGKGLLALPGGFLKQDETIEEGASRELIEETGIKVLRQELKNSIRGSKIFDKPDRSLRGRTITHAYFFDLGSGELPKVRGGERAVKATWVSIAELFENMENFFEDHFSIIEYFLYKA
jgi:bifunctional NMN adenylyltransferase/nudix hydrolase